MATLLGLYLQKTSSKINEQWERSGVRNYIAAATLDGDEVFVRTNLGSTLVINYPHPSDNGQVISEIEVEQMDESMLFSDPTNPSNANNGVGCYWWNVNITYGPWDPLTHTATGNPVDQPIDFSFQWQVFEQAADTKKVSGSWVPLVNSAHDPFDPPVTREQLKGILRVAYNSLTFTPSSFFGYGNLINNDVWNGFAAGTIKFSPPNMPQRLYSQYLGQNYYRLECEFAFNPNDGGWNAKPIDRGYRALDGSGNIYKIFDINGQPISQPALLDGSGHVLTSLGSYVQINCQVYDDLTFATAFPNLTSLF